MNTIQALDIQIPAEIIHNWGWFLAFGIGLVALGVAAVARSVTATVVSMLFFGWLLVIAAGIEIAQTILVGHWAGIFQHLLRAILFGVVGLLIVWRPVVTAEILTLLMGAFFLVAGVFELVAPAMISLPDWGWHVLNGVITLGLGVLVLAQWPVSGLWVIGLFLGIDLIFYGAAWIALALHLRAMQDVRRTDLWLMWLTIAVVVFALLYGLVQRFIRTPGPPSRVSPRSRNTTPALLNAA